MKRLFAAATLAAVLLGGCAARETDGRAVTLQETYAALRGWTCHADVCVVTEAETTPYTLEAAYDGTETRVSVLAPEALAGIGALVRDDGTLSLEYDGMTLAAGSLDPNVSAANAVSVFLDAVARGAAVEQGREVFEQTQDALRLCFEREHAGETLRVAGWFDENDVPLYAEIERDGEILAYLEFTDFAFGDIISQ